MSQKTCQISSHHGFRVKGKDSSASLAQAPTYFSEGSLLTSASKNI
jgi:hypothetical protein